MGEFKQFKNGAQFGAWLGIVPRQNSSRGKTGLGRITRRGDDDLRTLFIQGARLSGSYLGPHRKVQQGRL